MAKSKQPEITAEIRALFWRVEDALNEHNDVKCNKPGCELCERAHALYRELHSALQLPIWGYSPCDVWRALPPSWVVDAGAWRQAWRLRQELGGK